MSTRYLGFTVLCMLAHMQLLTSKILSTDSAIIFASDDLLHKPLKLLALMQGTGFQFSIASFAVMFCKTLVSLSAACFLVVSHDLPK